MKLDGPPKMSEDTFLCPMCRRDIPKRGKAYYIGNPTIFLICHDCWKGWVRPNSLFLSKVYRKTKVWKEQVDPTIQLKKRDY